MTAVDVVVPTFKRPEALKRCLKALSKQTRKPASIQVVDDSETDRGPAWARNQGIHRGKAPIVAFTDDDCVPDPDWIESIEAVFEDPAIDAIEGSLYRPLDGGEESMDRPAWVLHERYRTANMAVRRDALDEIGGFDEGYYIHLEDTDLAWRLRKAGHEVHFAPQVRVAHPDRGGVDRMNTDSAIRLYRVAPEWYAEILALRLHRQGIRSGAFQETWRTLTGTPQGDDLTPLSAGEKLTLLRRAFAIAAKWRLGRRGQHPEVAA